MSFRCESCGEELMRGRYRGQTALLVPPRTVSSDGGASVTTMDSPYQTHQALPARSQAPTLDQAFASRGSRLAASLIDGIVAGVLMIPLFVSAVMADASGGGPAALGGALAFGLVVLLIAFVVYQLSMLVREGQTICKKALNIRIVDYHSGDVLGWGSLLGMRYRLNSVLGNIPLYTLIDILLISGEE